MIQAIGLTSTARRKHLPRVDDLTFEARSGEVTVLLGPAGSGKSEALRLMLQLVPGRGVALFRGRPVQRIQHPAREIGVLLGDVPGHPARSARGHLRMLTAVAGVPAERADEVLEVVGLSGLADERLGNFSRGMDRRLGMAAALLGDPHTLVLDEPAWELSPREASWLYGLVRGYAEQGGLALIASRDPKVAARIADRVVTIDNGRLVADQTAADFSRTRLRPRVAVRTPHAERFAAVLSQEARSAERTQLRQGAVEVVCEGGSRISVYGTDCAFVGETAYRHGILVHQLTEEIGDTGDRFRPGPLIRADGRATARSTSARKTISPDESGGGETKGADVGARYADDMGEAVRDDETGAVEGGSITVRGHASVPAPGAHLPQRGGGAAVVTETREDGGRGCPATASEADDEPGCATGTQQAGEQAAAEERSQKAPEPSQEHRPASAEVLVPAVKQNSAPVTGISAPVDALPRAQRQSAPGASQSPAGAGRETVPEETGAAAQMPAAESESADGGHPAGPRGSAEEGTRSAGGPVFRAAETPDAQSAGRGGGAQGGAEGGPDPRRVFASDLAEPMPGRREEYGAAAATAQEGTLSAAVRTHGRRMYGVLRGRAGTRGNAASRTWSGKTPFGSPVSDTPGKRAVLPPVSRVVRRPGPVAPLQYELRRLFGVRTPWVLIGLALLAGLAVSVAVARVGAGGEAVVDAETGIAPALKLLTGWPPGSPFLVPPAALAAGLLGATAFGQEFRYPALVPAQVPVPRRLGLLVAKLAVTGGTAVALCAATALCNGVALTLLFGADSGALGFPAGTLHQDGLTSLSVPGGSAGGASVPSLGVQVVAVLALCVGCAWAGLLAAGVFRSTVLGVAAVVAVPLLVAPFLMEATVDAGGQSFGGLPERLRAVLLFPWPSVAERWGTVAGEIAAQPVGRALAFALMVLFCAYALTSLRGRPWRR
ncbi:ATP-binding cassette domain-containing protein [Streptomyces albus]|uniref:ATP-binding cassette domain-containing protein n=1 Tax=Streptomyces albus TaxID=1888 RepID=UPI00055B51B6|nr:ATP-binding cassette domain-containing protein [Streptomyces albus]QID38565.1 ATP-binding cassette domain-containing protein [Streptomyces albus]